MKLKTLFKKDSYNINYWRTRTRMSKYEHLVGSYIEKLSDYHLKNKNFDFAPVRNQLLSELLEYAHLNVPYYTSVLSNINLKDINEFESIPFLTKELIRNNEALLKSKIVPDSLLLKRKTGGSTGEPLSLWSTGNTEMLHQRFLYVLNDYKDGDKILAMDGTSIDTKFLNSNKYWQIKNEGNMLPYGGMTLSALYLNNDNIAQYVKFILEYEPDFIRGYPAFISDIAKYILENNITISFQIKAIEVTSEICLDKQRDFIKEAFKTKVIGQYGHTEAAVFGYTLDDSFKYYCSPLYGFTEIIDENDNHVSINEEGEVVVTGFSSFGFPLIRYRTGDRAIYGGDEFGITVLNKVLGRTADYLINKKGEKILLTALIFGQHYNAFSKIKKWQIVQNIPGAVEIKINAESNFNRDDQKEIQNAFLTIGQIDTSFSFASDFVKTNRGKAKFVIQNV